MRIVAAASCSTSVTSRNNRISTLLTAACTRKGFRLIVVQVSRHAELLPFAMNLLAQNRRRLIEQEGRYMLGSKPETHNLTECNTGERSLMRIAVEALCLIRVSISLQYTTLRIVHDAADLSRNTETMETSWEAPVRHAQFPPPASFSLKLRGFSCHNALLQPCAPSFATCHLMMRPV